MGAYGFWHAAITLFLLVGLPMLAVWLVIRTSRRRTGESISLRMQQMEQLRRQGLLSEEEFERKRADLVRKL